MSESGLPARYGPVDVRVLGPLELIGPAGRIEIRRGLPRVLLSTLLVRIGEVVPADVLIDQLWVNTIPVNPANALQVQVSYVRRQLRPLGQSIRIERDGVGYRLVAAPDVIDATRFAHTVADVSAMMAGDLTRPDGIAALTAIETALGLWRGSAHADASHVPVVEADHHRLEQLRIVASEQRGVLLDRLGRHDEAAAWLEPLAAANPLREALWVALIGALYRAGRQAEALRAFATARSHLVEDLGIEPGPELRAIERAVLEHDPALLAPPTITDIDPSVTAYDPPGAAAADEPVDEHSNPGMSTPRTHRLPASVSALIGRAWEVQQIRAQLTDHRLLTVVGVGGVGKTRLAFEAARSLGHPVLVVEFGGLENAASVPALIAAAIPVPVEANIDPLDVVADRIGDDEWLVVLDNCEHLVDVIAAAVTRLLTSCGGLRILATSRQPLDVAGEMTWPVPLLELPDQGSTRAVEVGAASAVRLFVERARAIDPAFVLDDDNAAAVADICRSLDGLPLAIELAAGRIGVLSPAAIRDRLQDRFALLTGGRRDVAARQRSLHATVEWSFEQLAVAEQEFFCALGVFNGTFDLAGATAVAALGDEVVTLDRLATLVSHSLVVSDGGDRYRLLDTLRAFARSELAGGRDDSLSRAQHRLADWIRDVVVACDPFAHGPLPEGWPRLHAESANIRATLDWAFAPAGDHQAGARIVGALAGSLALSGEFADAERWLALAAGVEADDETRATVHRGLAVVALYQGRFDAALEAAERSHRYAVRTGIDQLAASCAIAWGSAAWGVGDLQLSATVLRRAADTFDVRGDVRGRGFALARLSRTLSDLDDPDAVDIATAAVDDLETSQDDWVGVVALDHLAYTLLATGDYRAAAVRAQQAIALAERIGSTSGGLAALSLLGRIRLAEGDLAASTDAQRAIVLAAERLRNFGAVADALDGLADVLIADHRYLDAAATVGAADELRRRARTRRTPSGAARSARRLEVLRATTGASALVERIRSGTVLAPADILELTSP